MSYIRAKWKIVWEWCQTNWKFLAVTAPLVLGVFLVIVFPTVREITGTFLLVFPAYTGAYAAYVLTKFEQKIHLQGTWRTVAILAYATVIAVIVSPIWFNAAQQLQVTGILYFAPYAMGFVFTRGLELPKWFSSTTGEG